MGPLPAWVSILVRVTAMFAIVIGLVVFLVTVVVGDCATFGGTCPAEGLKGDVLGGAAIGGAMVGAGAVLAFRPTRKALLSAGITAAVVGLICAVIAQGITSR
jgi:hypothetical protein